MRIKEQVKKSGYFWLPSVPEKQIAGTITITDGGNIELKLVELLDESINSINNSNDWTFARIIGSVEELGYVTLEDCFYKKKTHSFGGQTTSIICVNKAFIGVQYGEKEEILLNSFRFSVEGIDEWVGISGINFTREDSTTFITYASPKQILLKLSNDINLIIMFLYTLPGFSSIKEAKITQKIYFKLVSEQDIPLEDFISASHKIITLLCFAINEIVCLEEVVATSHNINNEGSNGQKRPVPITIYYSSVPYTNTIPKIIDHKMLFKFRDIQQNAEQFFNNWFDAYNKYGSALNLYFSVKMKAHKYFENNFLALIQALESYHRRISDKTQMSEDEFNTLKEKLLEHCPEERKDWLKGKLHYGNEVGLRTRLKGLINPLNEYFGNEKEKKYFIESLVNTRNYLTHYDETLKSRAIEGKDLYFICHKMEVIFQIYLLKMLGFDKQKVDSIVKNNSMIKQKLN